MSFDFFLLLATPTILYSLFPNQSHKPALDLLPESFQSFLPRYLTFLQALLSSCLFFFNQLYDPTLEFRGEIENTRLDLIPSAFDLELLCFPVGVQLLVI